MGVKLGKISRGGGRESEGFRSWDAAWRLPGQAASSDKGRKERRGKEKAKGGGSGPKAEGRVERVAE
eukprot:6201219-Pleurochrysis_carterae.AAC.1